MDETMTRIQKTANEQQMMYRQAAKSHLTPEQASHLRQLEGDLITLWNQHRAELASRHHTPNVGIIAPKRSPRQQSEKPHTD